MSKSSLAWDVPLTTKALNKLMIDLGIHQHKVFTPSFHHLELSSSAQDTGFNFTAVYHYAYEQVMHKKLFHVADDNNEGSADNPKGDDEDDDDEDEDLPVTHKHPSRKRSANKITGTAVGVARTRVAM